MDKIKIFDTTLRDGEQSPGFSMNLPEKLRMAAQLELLGVDVIEAGFPVASPADFEAVQKIGQFCGNAEVCGLARCHPGDIEAVAKALEGAKKPRIHVFIASSDIHLKHKLKLSREDSVKRAIDGVKMARSFCERVDFSPEDATRSDWDFLAVMLEEVIKAGADTINIPDTVGFSTPQEFGELVGYLKENVKGIDGVVISTHCHNDLGLAVANSLAGVRAGAGQIECTVNGIGERAGNAALEEIVMALKTRPQFYQKDTNIDTTQLLASSKLLTQITGQSVQPNKAVVGKNAFAHEAGIHQHGLLANKATYEIMKPEDIGHTKSELILGKHSGRNALAHRLKDLKISVSKEKLSDIFVKFKELADKKKNIYDEDLIMLANDNHQQEKFELIAARILSDTKKGARARVAIKVGEESHEEEGRGDGPVDALYAAIIKITEIAGELKEFKVNALTPDKGAIGIVDIGWEEDENHFWHGQGADTDITFAAGKALIDVLNRMEIRRQHDKYRGRQEFVSTLLNT